MTDHSTFEYPFMIRERHLDTFGHVNNATYLEIFEEARWEIITGRGFGLAEIKTTGISPVILEVNVRFLKELYARTEVVVKSQLSSYEGKVGVMKQWIENKNGQICCQAEFKIGLFDLARRKLIEPSPEWLKAIS